MHARALLFTLYGSYIRHYGGKIDIASLVRLMGEHGLTPGAVRAAVLRVTQQGWLEARTKRGKRYYALTEPGRRRMLEAAERIYKFKRVDWDGKWRMLVYNLPESRHELRNQIRQELKWLGWGSLSNSAWITPNNIVDITQEHLRSYRVNRHIEIFEAQHLGFSDEQELVKKCWDLSEIEARYRQFQRQFRARLEEALASPLSPETAFVEKTELVHEYRKFLFIDPRLPKEFSSVLSYGEEMSQLFLEYYRALHDSSLSFFEEVISARNQEFLALEEGRRQADMDLPEITAANEFLSASQRSLAEVPPIAPVNSSGISTE
jgi:phenylacetic acid degradation operon negative regulatory protein